MTRSTTRTALITGANSGLGFETARQLGLDPRFGTIVLACRTQAKGEAARAALVELCGGDADRFEVLAADVSSVASTRAAMDRLHAEAPGLAFDLVVLNAGRVGGPTLEMGPDGVEIAYAASLTGHHVMTLLMLENAMLKPDAAVVIAGAEAARGTLPGMALYDVREIAESQHGGDLIAAMTAMARGEAPSAYHARNNLATLKAFTQWWGAALARRLRERAVPVRLFVVSPGGTPSTNGVRYLPWFQRLMLRVLDPIMRAVGQTHDVESGAARYIAVLDRPASDSGRFFASPAGRNTGPLTDNTPMFPHFGDVELQDAALATLEELTDQRLAA